MKSKFVKFFLFLIITLCILYTLQNLSSPAVVGNWLAFILLEGSIQILIKTYE